MTFKGGVYEALIDLQQLLNSQEILLKAYEEDYKTKMKQRSPLASQSETMCNTQRKFVEKLYSLNEMLADDILKMAHSLGDVEAKIFIYKWALGYDNKKIMELSGISKSSYFRYIDSINEVLEDDERYKNLDRIFRIKD